MTVAVPEALRPLLAPIDSVHPAPHNPRQGHAVDGIARSLRDLGWHAPVVVREDGELIIGHGRLAAAKQLGLEELPVLVVDDDKGRALVRMVADNRLNEMSDWAEPELAELIDDHDVNDDLLDWKDDLNLDEILDTLDDGEGAGSGGTDPDDTPPVPDTPVTRHGDLWVLGRHRLVCGDSTDKATVRRVLGDATPNLMVTDPPYGVEYDASWREDARLNGAGAARGKVKNDDRADWSEAWAHFPGSVAYVWFGSLSAPVVAKSLERHRFVLRSLIIWGKHRLVISRGHYHWQHEPCWYGVRKGKTASWKGDRKQSTLWDDIEHSASETGHSTQKPVEAMRRPIANHKGDVYEPFSGSGTTIIAAEMERRSAYAIELNPSYVDVAVSRWQDFTGLEAVLADTGETFAERCA